MIYCHGDKIYPYLVGIGLRIPYSNVSNQPLCYSYCFGGNIDWRIIDRKKLDHKRLFIKNNKLGIKSLPLHYLHGIYFEMLKFLKILTTFLKLPLCYSYCFGGNIDWRKPHPPTFGEQTHADRHTQRIGMCV